MTFLYPWVLLLIPLYLLCLYICRPGHTQRYFSNVPLLLQAVGKYNDYEKWIRAFVIIMMIIALSVPISRKQSQPTPHQGYDVALLLDASDSMHESKRFEHAKKIIGRFVKGRPHDRMALELFADHPYIAIAMTYEKQVFPKILPHLHIGIAGKRYTALNEALFLGSNLFDSSSNHAKFIILLTDGLNTVKSVPLEITLKKLQEKNIKVYTIGIGDDYRKGVLTHIADLTGGKFYPATNPNALKSIYEQISSIQKERFKTQTLLYFVPLFRYPISLAVFGLILLLWLEREEKHKRTRVLLALVLTGIALYGPSVSDTKNHTTHKTPIHLLIGLDLSDSMNCADDYPSRLKLSAQKASKLIDMLPCAQIGLIGYGSQAYIISAPTHDHKALQSLLSSIDTSHINTRGTNLTALLEGANLFRMQDPQPVVLFTDGGENKNFTDSIRYAKAHHLNISVYLLGTSKGGVIPERKSIREDDSGNIIITKTNPSIGQLSSASHGISVRYSSGDSSIIKIARHIKSLSKKQKLSNESYQNRHELYGLFLIPALLLLLWNILWNMFKHRRKR